MQPDPVTHLPGLGRTDSEQLLERLQAASEPRDPWQTPPYVPPPALPLLDKANAISKDLEANAAEARKQLMASSHSPLRNVVPRQSPLVTPERLRGVLVSLTG